MQPRWSQLWTLLCLLFIVHVASGEVFRIAPRAEGNPEKTTASNPGTTSTHGYSGATRTKDISVKQTESSETTGTQSEKSSIFVTTTETDKTRNSDPSSTSTEGSLESGLDSSSYYNATIPAGKLPLEPRLTPGWGVAGTTLLVTGPAYGLIGIKNRMIHTFFSTAFAASLGVAVLIVYVMKSEVSDALEGGYVVAAVISGCVLGGASMFFREITEGLGCALGGFCISMWLLCLVPGGLLGPVVAKAIFIACFTVGGFAFYFSHYTRDWALILMISFSGATVTVLGIDCFSRAGLKEFWAYVWELNDDLFPLGANTYPVTKGIRVETAAIIIIFLFGIISQIKLWKIVREKREKKAEEAAEGERSLREEEEQVGRNIEEANARERRQWERIYGDGDMGSSTASRLSEDAEPTNEKKGRNSQTDSSQTRSTSIVEVIEMREMAEDGQRKKQPTVTLMSSDHDEDGRVTVRVASDDTVQPAIGKGYQPSNSATNASNPPIAGEEADRRVSAQSSVAKSVAPPVIPLPFTIPVADDNDDAFTNGDRSSVATFADEEDTGIHTPGHRHSLAKRLSRFSRGSMELLGNISHRSSRVFGDHQENGHGESTDELVIPRSRPRDDDGSVAATIDDESVSGDCCQSRPTSEFPKGIDINAKLSEGDDLGKTSPSQSHQEKLASVDVNIALKSEELEQQEGPPSGDVDKTKSATSGSSAPISLTKDRLPRSLSRVALSYRTNEWAKHLSNAEAPEVDEIHADVPRNPAVPSIEAPAPVHVNELRKSSHEGTPAPANLRPDSQASNYSQSASRRSVKQHVPAALALLTGEGQSQSPGTTPTSSLMPRSSSGGLRVLSGGIVPIAEEQAVSSLTPLILEEQPIVAQKLNPPAASEGLRTSISGVVSYSSPQTLLGQREMYLRNKSAGNLVPSSSEVHLPARHRASSDAGSLNNYPMYAAAVGVDVDDLPLNQRKELMRQSSLSPSVSTPSLQRLSGGSNSNGFNSSEALLNTHQPKRVSTLPTSAAREAALANFRQSVQHELRAGTPVISSSGRETPFTPKSLLASREVEVQRSVDMSRNILLSQKQAEAQRRETQQREKEWADKAFDERMRNGDLLDVHREAMRKLQRHAKDM
ncbi:sulfite exporter family [Fusarium beomiforme]|uniref:Sulfite exporter family n=1 Tax=Fusarium beomiforme TaxID=44412 RepID=A0A9P5AH70_9HYPO|nr:sulfite exporter family [Fusarium beomiforme]